MSLPAPFRLIALDRVGSTNDEALRLARDGLATDFLVVSAAEQTCGRGRRGRIWISPPGNLHCSMLLSIGADLGSAAQAGFVAAVALVDCLRRLVPGVDIRCKWPNDVLAGGAKVAGMLLEPAGRDWLVLGLGIDVAACPPPDAVEAPAAALAALGYGGDAAGLLAAFCEDFHPWVDLWRRSGFAPLRQAWLDRAVGLSQPIQVRLERETLGGIFTAIDTDGALLLGLEEGGTRRIVAGDVFFPVPAVN